MGWDDWTVKWNVNQSYGEINDQEKTSRRSWWKPTEKTKDTPKQEDHNDRKKITNGKIQSLYIYVIFLK